MFQLNIYPIYNNIVCRLFEERAEKVRSAVEKLIRDHQPKISHSTNLLNLIKNFENIAKNNEKVHKFNTAVVI